MKCKHFSFSISGKLEILTTATEYRVLSTIYMTNSVDSDPSSHYPSLTASNA